MKKKYYMAAVVIAILLIAGVAVGIEAYDRKKTQEAIDSIEQEILFLHFAENPFAEDIGTIWYGYFIDKHGNKCYLDTTERDIYVTGDIYGYLEEHIEEYEKVPFLEGKQVLTIYQYLNSIDNNAKVVKVKTELGTDAWSYTGFRISQNGEIEQVVLEEESGGSFEYKADENAEKIMEIIGKDTWRDEEELRNRFR